MAAVLCLQWNSLHSYYNIDNTFFYSAYRYRWKCSELFVTWGHNIYIIIHNDLGGYKRQCLTVQFKLRFTQGMDQVSCYLVLRGADCLHPVLFRSIGLVWWLVIRSLGRWRDTGSVYRLVSMQVGVGSEKKWWSRYVNVTFDSMNWWNEFVIAVRCSSTTATTWVIICSICAELLLW
jgi:hypothetical protein